MKRILDVLLCILALAIVVSGAQQRPVKDRLVRKTRPLQQCPSSNDLEFNQCLSACQSITCADVRKESRSGTRPCVRMCVSGWACPRGRYILDGYADVCVQKRVCRRKRQVTECSYDDEVFPVNVNFLKGDLVCRCFVDGQVRCRNPFPES
ncbi:uncharacterized protein [Diadema setosum]|uniref:uncharacterized protein n=1 Tax=Diadema setosum TaxID=31175 RepID=UPI003B3A0908